ncbi:MAG: cadmium-translocating P-type ATPase [Rhodospirillales bacterium]|nr:cadmium-translocating P-type ATPase [Rhodospirillales bacterium]
MAPFDGTQGRAGCAHCALPVADGARFCCTGCEAAYAAVEGLGLDAFYARRRLGDGARNLKPEEHVAFDYAGRTRIDADGNAELHLMVEGLTCAACVWLIESVYAREPDVRDARVNLSTGRLVLKWKGSADRATSLAELVARLGFKLVPFDPSCLDDAHAREEKDLLRATGVAGFAAGNVMMLSVAVWVGVDMGPATKDLLHWVSALIGLPCIFYAGLPFYRSAATALRAGRLNMDVPIAVGVTMTAAMSLSETIRGGPYAYFDAALTLLFFLLAGRYLDRRARGRARASAAHLIALSARPVTVAASDGTLRSVSADAVKAGEIVLAASGERIGVDGRVVDGVSAVDESVVTGETLPRDVAPGARVYAGMVNLGPALRIETTATGERTLLAEIVRLVEAAEHGRSRFVAIAERVTRLYAPVVHVTALATFLGWFFLAGAPWQVALLYAVATLIITCPCALGLAVPSVQTIASGRLMRGGILLKNATALERLAEIDTVVFDKTGTLTSGRPTLRDEPGRVPGDLRLAASIAASSRHPLARALCRAHPEFRAVEGVVETPGAGLEWNGIRLGSRAFCGISGEGAAVGPEIWLAEPGGRRTRFAFDDVPRADAADAVAALKARGIAVELLSGDRAEIVAAMAGQVGIATFHGGVSPAEKTARLAALAAAGRRVLMVGDGLNDAPALAAAHASLSPASGADVAQVAADAVFQGSRLGAAVELLDVAARAKILIRQNIVMSIVYNALAVPLAVLGMVTPPIAAALMSSSSIVVVANALRLSRGKETRWIR